MNMKTNDLQKKPSKTSANGFEKPSANVSQKATASLSPPPFSLKSTNTSIQRKAYQIEGPWDNSEKVPVGNNSVAPIQRELATPRPEETPAEQEDLTERQIRNAIWYNRARYDERNTRMIQDIVGVEPTGTWDERSVLAVARVQEDYGLQKDGLVGPNMFRWLDNEMDLEGLSEDTDDTLLMFLTPIGNVAPYLINAGTSNPGIEGHFNVLAQFPERTGCAQWEYRQFIRGSAQVTRGSRSQNVNNFFTALPAGRLTSTWQEDGNTNWAGPNYGHRRQPGRASNPINRYEDAGGSANQRSGCVYKGEDFPHFMVNAITGDILTLNLHFMGRVVRRRNGRREIVQTKRWSIRGNVTVP